MRNIAIYDDKVFHVTKGEPSLIAVNARTGELEWEVPVEGSFSSGPIVVGGKVVSGRSCSPVDGPRSCFIAAYDADSGEEVWRTGTIVRPDEPGGDSWGDLPYEERRHVGAWGVGATTGTSTTSSNATWSIRRSSRTPAAFRGSSPARGRAGSAKS